MECLGLLSESSNCEEIVVADATNVECHKEWHVVVDANVHYDETIDNMSVLSDEIKPGPPINVSINNKWSTVLSVYQSLRQIVFVVLLFQCKCTHFFVLCSFYHNWLRESFWICCLLIFTLICLILRLLFCHFCALLLDLTIFLSTFGFIFFRIWSCCIFLGIELIQLFVVFLLEFWII